MMQLSNESGLGRALDKFRPLCGKRIALLDADGFDFERLAALRQAFALAGAEVVLVAPTPDLTADQVDGRAIVLADARLCDTAPEVYHALCIPGSRAAVAVLRGSEEARHFVANFVRSGKWIGTLDNGPLLLESSGISGRTVTSDPALRAELERAGAAWVPEAVIADQRLVTAQGKDQLEAFVRVATLSFQEKRRDPPPGYH